MKVLSVIKDDRIDSTSVLMDMTFDEYLQLVTGAEQNLEIQRRIVKGFKPYERLREDLKSGCLIPAPVLAIAQGFLPDATQEQHFADALANINPEQVYIVDGLQRTNAIQQVVESLDTAEAEADFRARHLRVEVWPDISLKALTYRMILLNAGQKPMSLRHQLEVVSNALCDQLKLQFPDRLEIYREKETERRSAAGEYRFSLIASAFQAFVQKSPHIDLRNEVISELNQIDALEAYGRSINRDNTSDPTSAFVEYVDFLVDLDRAVCRVYPEKRQNDRGEEIPSGISLFARETIHLGLAAAYAWCNDYKKDVLATSKLALLRTLEEAQPNIDDPMAFARLERIQTGFKRKDNVGEQTRNLVFAGFKEYFRSEGLTPFAEAWTQAA
jgi:hypothetical protein